MAKKRKTDSVAPPPAPAPREPNEAGVQSKPTPGLYLVATPIGNLRDITLRALDLLRGADVIACEDTRVTRKLLQAYGITTPMLSYHEHNAQAMRPKLMKRMPQRAFLLALAAAVLLAGQAGTVLAQSTLRFYNWSNYFPPDLLEAFTAETGISVTTEYYSDNETLLASLQSGASYDLVVPSDYMSRCRRSPPATSLYHRLPKARHKWPNASPPPGPGRPRASPRSTLRCAPAPTRNSTVSF